MCDLGLDGGGASFSGVVVVVLVVVVVVVRGGCVGDGYHYRHHTDYT